jgi:hypothetical protein
VVGNALHESNGAKRLANTFNEEGLPIVVEDSKFEEKERLREEEKANRLTTGQAGELLGVSSQTVRRWIEQKKLPVLGTYKNDYGTICYLLAREVVTNPETLEKLAPEIDIAKKRREAGQKALTTRVKKERDQYEQYLKILTEKAPTSEVAELLKAAYFLWHLNHYAKLQTEAFDRARLYSMKDKMLQALVEYFVDFEQPYLLEQALELFGLQPDRLETGVGYLLKNTALAAAYRPQPAFFLEHTRTLPAYWYGRSGSEGRHYLGLVICFSDFRFPFHGLWDNAKIWLPAKVTAQLRVRDWEGADETPFTFGGRATTWLEERAIPEQEITGALAEIYNRLTGKSKLDFVSFTKIPLLPKDDSHTPPVLWGEKTGEYF